MIFLRVCGLIIDRWSCRLRAKITTISNWCSESWPGDSENWHPNSTSQSTEVSLLLLRKTDLLIHQAHRSILESRRQGSPLSQTQLRGHQLLRPQRRRVFSQSRQSCFRPNPGRRYFGLQRLHRPLLHNGVTCLRSSFKSRSPPGRE